MKNILIIAKPSWGKTLELFQQHGSIRLQNSDAAAFEAVLEAIGIEFKTEVDSVSALTRFTLKQK